VCYTCKVFNCIRVVLLAAVLSHNLFVENGLAHLEAVRIEVLDQLVRLSRAYFELCVVLGDLYVVILLLLNVLLSESPLIICNLNHLIS
jgi:hypothetical protein